MNLLQTRPILQVEANIIALIDRTFVKAARVATLDYKKELPTRVRQEFRSRTFALQLDKLITELILQSFSYAGAQAKQLTAATAPTLNPSFVLTEEAVRLSGELSKDCAESVVRMLAEDAIYYESPRALATRITDLWGNEKYRAERFARTFTADVATASTVSRYRQLGIRYMEFNAEVDDKTTSQCRCLDGTIFDLEKGSVDAYRPPLHMHCRSGLIPLSDSDFEETRLFENRDFSNALENQEEVDRAFKQIDSFNDNYRVSKLIIDKDLAARYMFEKGFSVGMSGPDFDIILKQATTKKGTGLVDVKGNPITSMQGVFDSIDNKAPTIEIPPETSTLLSDGSLIKHAGKELRITSIKGNSVTGGYITLESGEQLYVSWLQVMRQAKYIKEDISNAVKKNRPPISIQTVIEKKGHFYLGT